MSFCRLPYIISHICTLSIDIKQNWSDLLHLLYYHIAPRAPHKVKVMAKVALIVTVMMSEWLVTFFCPTPTEITFSGGQRKLCSEYIIERKAQNTNSNENVTRILIRTTTQWICWILNNNITQQSWTRLRIWWQKCFKLLSKASEISRKSCSYHVVQLLNQF